MKKYILTLLALMMTGIITAQPAERKKVGVVLSGGGAKGAAHVRALKVIEEAGIPVDIIVGTSMGSLVGGMYASGYNADQIDSLVRCQDWKTLLTDATMRTEKELARRQQLEKYAMKVTFQKSPTEVIEGGLLKGNNVAKLITRVTADTPDSISFNSLKIPFACVTTDILTGKEVVLHNGIMAESMRASMSIPMVFTPVRKGDMLLVDGGMTNNYPVDVARAMGADYVIGVDVTTPMSTTPDEVTTAPMMMSQIMDQMCSNKLKENVAATDVHIKVDVSGYSSASFTAVAIDTLMRRGEEAARSKWNELMALRDTLGLTEPVAAPARRPAPANPDILPPASIYKERLNHSFLGFGARFDNEEKASIILGGMYEFNAKHAFRVGVQGRLGRRVDAEAYTSVRLGRSAWTAMLKYNIQHNDITHYHNGESVVNNVYTGHRVFADLSHGWRNFIINVGAEFSYYHFNSVKASEEHQEAAKDTSPERGLGYYARLTYDNLDARVNARKGVYWEIGYQFFTDNGRTFKGGHGQHILHANWRMPISLSRTTILTPNAAARFIAARNDYFTKANFFGGVNTDGHYMPQQISFAGVNNIEVTLDNLIVTGVMLRQHLTTNNYVFAVGNYGIMTDDILHPSTNPLRHMAGAALGYGYNSPAGPIEFNINWSNVTKKVGCFINIGFMF